jgi:hypothetical protein
LFDSQEDENIFFQLFSVSLGGFRRYGRELIVYRALSYAIIIMMKRDVKISWTADF